MFDIDVTVEVSYDREVTFTAIHGTRIVGIESVAVSDRELVMECGTSSCATI